MNIKTYLNLVLVVVTALISTTFLLSAAIPVAADHGRSVIECEEFYLGGEGMELCVEHARIDTQYEDCQYIPDVREVADCVNRITPAADGYFGRTFQPDSDASTGGGEDGDALLQPLELNNNASADYDAEAAVKDNPIYQLLLTFINFLTAGVGLVVTTLVVVGGLQYMTAGGNPQKTQAAIVRISNALIGLVLYIFMFAILQWLIPGGLFG